MEEAPENGKESPHSVYANGLIDRCTVTAKRAVLMLLTFLSMNKVTMPEGYDIEQRLTDRVEHRVDSYI